ncbi:MAG: hypothetical protein PVJ63_07555 [Thioalkalispiraceae bacterium]|jgi:hypothetical protein
MKTNQNFLLLFSSTLIYFCSSLAIASPSISGGVWFNYRNTTDSDFSSAPFSDELDSETSGDIADEAFILYVDDKQEDRPWSLSAEVRFGPGSFTDPANNSTGDSYTVHKAWVGYQLNEHSQLQIGKSQVPFGWKTVNFWPGDILLGGYGDQMDVGIKYSRNSDDLDYQLAYYHADDWGETSTDSTDDNGHWGSSDTYRKVQTVVANLDYTLTDQHTIGLSLQSGRLQDLSSYSTTPEDADIDGSHSAINLHYHGTFKQLYTKAQFISVTRELPNSSNDIENRRIALEVGYSINKWFYYLDSSLADTRTTGNDADRVAAHAIGASYNYGPGWMYLEYLTQNGDIGRDGDIYEADFSAVYATIDYYF